MFGNMNQCRGRTRDPRGQGSVQRGMLDHVILLVSVHPLVGQGRRGFPAVDHDLFAVAGAVYQPEAAAAETGTVRLNHTQGGTHRNGRVKCVPPFP